ncbi:DUF1302 family protein [Desulfobacterium sp. N47]|uniref:TonB-dependent receptor-like beta-barrel domain-containing protein n=1 Tax=uncultured Desulfobacterium sp. TaxID=201089 RepID=E1YEI5_9BACT|nr:hypothetical protein N47_P16840 [uncultured Desulfobacterium sp.]
MQHKCYSYFMTISYKGDFGRGFFRPGRQIVFWGEGLLETLLDVINPPDNSFNLFFQNPDDVKTPLWMGRINYSMPRLSSFGLNFDLLWIPDIRPTQFGPLDGVLGDRTAGFQAPYVSVTPFADLKGLPVRQDVPTANNKYGAKVSAEIGTRFNLSFVYFRDVVNDPAIQLVNLVGFTPTKALLTYGKQHVYGGYFSYQLLALGMEAVIRGEISHYTAYPITRATPVYDAGENVLKTYALKPVTKTMLAVDKDLRLRWLSKDLTKVSLEWIHTTINEWDNVLDNEKLDPIGRVTGTINGVAMDRRNSR